MPSGKSLARTESRRPHRGRPMLVTLGKLAACAGTLIAMGASATGVQPAAIPHRAPLEAYLMDPAQEITLARSAAPTSVSKDATVLVLTPTGYETAVIGTNGFVCMVSRGFSGFFDWPERWNPRIRAAECLNLPAAHTMVPIAKMRTSMALAGRTTEQTIEHVRRSLRSGKVPALGTGAMSYMMSKSSYLTDEGEHDMPHLMYFISVRNGAGWGANAPDSPIVGGSYWFFTPNNPAETQLPAISVFITGVAKWSDGTAAKHPM